ncbi:Chemotaxis protein methyltransferase CheR [hydrothermal vent metagenome]|uniref:protein-glutamate O-methyltransferase n=1 Tax=hydrothermal vent metagenome TaxID=652676 RepID=A0A3B1BK36_9ZZZZ
MATEDQHSDKTLWRYHAPAQMDRVQLAMWIELLEKRTGICLAENRKSFLLTSLSTRMRELGYDSYDAYFQFLLKGRRGAVEWEILVDRLTVHESRFYRDPHALALIQDQFLPELSSTRDRLKNKKQKSIDIWSLGCATGEEAYSLAMLVEDFMLTNNLDGYYSITATDISSAALSTARKGIFHINRLKNVPARLINLFFNSEDENHYRIAEKLRKRICFTRLNSLYLSRARLGMMDLIYCQNVLIYFKRRYRYMMLDQIVRYLRPNGVLILGAGEISDWRHTEMEAISYSGTLAFKRIQGECQL